MAATTARQYAQRVGQASPHQQFPHLYSGYVNSTGGGPGKEVTWSLLHPGRYLQHALQLLQRCCEPLVLSPQLRHGVRVAPLLCLSLGQCRRLLPQQAALLLQAGDFAFQLVHLQPRGETVWHTWPCTSALLRGRSRGGAEKKTGLEASKAQEATTGNHVQEYPTAGPRLAAQLHTKASPSGKGGSHTCISAFRIISWCNNFLATLGHPQWSWP